ncbi:MAG: putative rane protein [Firmicutes bacterium]|nr:putative rane protein [Bacillota bacterium]
MSNRDEKKQKFTQPQKNNTLLYSIIGIITVVIMIGTYFIVSNNNKPDTSVSAAADIGQKMSYSSDNKLQQTKVESKVENGKAIVTTLSAVKEKKFIWTEYKANGKRIPLTAFVQPDGKVMVAVSFCEPCKGETFHITGNQIVCNVCGTTWDLQTLKGLRGGCQDYPPEALNYSLNGDNLEIPQTVLDAWKPRV